MIGYDQGYLPLAVLVYPAPQTPQLQVTMQQIVSCNSTHGKYQYRLDQFDLALQVVMAAGHLFGGRVAVVRRTTLENIRNVHVLRW